MFKKLVTRVAEIETLEQYNAVCGEVDDAFNRERISWSDHELLYNLLAKVWKW